MRIVLDTNVLVSCALGHGEVMRRIRDAWQRDAFTVLLSAAIVIEVERTLSKPYFQQRLTTDLLHEFLRLLRSATEDIAALPAVSGVATHPEDDLILATAQGGQAEVIVTGDKHLLSVGSFDSIRIISPHEFAASLDQPDEPDGATSL